MHECQTAGVPIKPFNAQEPLIADVYIDALLGIGLQGRLKAEVIAAIEYINQKRFCPAKVIAIDLPSGLCADTGEVLDDAVKADLTVTLIGIKQGLVTGKAAEYCGDIICDDSDLPEELLTEISPSAKIISRDDYQNFLLPRKKFAHKGDYGAVLIIGGDLSMAGAVQLAALAAARSGAGLVRIATRPEHATLINTQQLEIICHGVNSTKELAPLIASSTVIVIGPGLGQSSWAKKMLLAALHSELPLIVDADGLNLLAQKKVVRDNWILTPHPGEAARLLDDGIENIQADRFSAAQKIAAKYHATTVLKGSGTIVIPTGGDSCSCNVGNRHVCSEMHVDVCNCGCSSTTIATPVETSYRASVQCNHIQCHCQLPSVCVAGNPGMASAGMGDILSGVIGGLVAQGLDLNSAACLGVTVHAEAGDLASLDGERGMLASDLLPWIRKLMN